MEFMISAPICFVAGVLGYWTVWLLGRYVMGRATAAPGNPLILGWVIALAGAFLGLWYYGSRVFGLELADSLDVVRVAFGYSLWLVFCIGTGVGGYVVARRQS